MRMGEARARYAAWRAQGGEALLGWQTRGQARPGELVCPSLEAALRLAARLASEAACHTMWLYDGTRLYDAAAIARLVAARVSDPAARQEAADVDAPQP